MRTDSGSGSVRHRKHADRGHQCPFCDKWFFGNGGWSAHFKKEMLDRMPDVSRDKPIEYVKAEWFYRKDEGRVTYDAPPNKSLVATD